ncbi:MAG: glycosyltransferase family 2 protein [Candidatus Brocadiaceae bacterium]|nr:glycosyltransferase family 2 protein [Candidatus Brocadiaceae bacterium]
MHLTIVICTHNRAQLLRKTLGSLNQTDRPSNCEIDILVIANACTDNTEEVLGTYKTSASDKGWLPLHWEEEHTPGKSFALNHAISKITTPVIVFVDDDHRVSKNWLIAVCRALQEHPEVPCFCGRILPDWDGKEPTWVHDNGQYCIRPFPVPNFDLGNVPIELKLGMYIPGGGNLFLRRSVFERIGLFSEQLGPTKHNLSGGEDMDFVVRAIEGGERFVYIPGAIQYHYVDYDRLTLQYLVKKAYKRLSVSRQVRSSPSMSISRSIPFYLYRQIISRFLKAIFTINQNRRRFYLVRLASTLGEIEGYWKSAKKIKKQL